MKKMTLIYGLALAAAVFTLQWLEYQYALHLFSTEIYIVILAAFFTALGVWVGARITQPRSATVFEKNSRVIETLGISTREYQVLQLLANGHSNQEIAEQLYISKSTIKTHLVHLYQKLGVSRRTQAIQKAKALHIIP